MKRKVTMTIDAAVLDQIKRTVEEGKAESQSGLVQEAVVTYIASLDKEALRAAYAEAAADPDFLADIETVMREFEPLDEELEVE